MMPTRTECLKIWAGMVRKARQIHHRSPTKEQWACLEIHEELSYLRRRLKKLDSAITLGLAPKTGKKKQVHREA